MRFSTFMNPGIQQLHDIASKESRIILGLMSGTSLDGLDLCLCHIKGAGSKTQISIIQYETLSYSNAFINEIKAVFANRDADLAMVSAMHAKIGIAHAELILDTLKKWKISSKQIDLIASHGQTIFHAPRSLFNTTEYPNSTLQIGDGDHIAKHTGIITLSDFRQKHVAAGGEGAPLVVYGDQLLFSAETEHRVLLNIGGISNFTFLPAYQHRDKYFVFASDIGPGNTLMNQYMKVHFNKSYDHNGETALKGKPHRALLEQLLQHPFFDLEFPKTTGPESFNLDFLREAQTISKTIEISEEDTMATLAEFTIQGIIKSLLKLPLPMEQLSIYVSGGGWNNPVLSRGLRKAVQPAAIDSIDVIGVPGDAKEAMLFALLANETLAGETPLQFAEAAHIPAVYMGKISLPD